MADGRDSLKRWVVASAAGLALGALLAVASPATTQKKKVVRSSRVVKRGKRGARAAAVPSYQLHPDPDRYKEIQQALAERGYYKGEVNGEWNGDSTDALKRFQADQKLADDGKINALSLTALGLGPKHDGSTAAAAPAPPPSEVTAAPAPAGEPAAEPPLKPPREKED